MLELLHISPWNLTHSCPQNHSWCSYHLPSSLSNDAAGPGWHLSFLLQTETFIGACCLQGHPATKKGKVTWNHLM